MSIWKSKNFWLKIMVLPLVLYIIIRVFTIGITIDEAWTITAYIPRSIGDILSCTPCDANNHLLNTILIKLLYQIDKSLYIARLPNLVAGFIYLFFAYRIATGFFEGLLKYVVLVALITNPFILDYFGMARGYGLALAFTLSSVYFILRFEQYLSLKWLGLSLITASLSVISNYSYLNYFLSVLIVLTFISITRRYSIKKLIVYIVIACTLLTSIIYEPLRKLIQGGNFYYGGNDGIYTDSLHTLTRHTLYDRYNFGGASMVLNVFLLLTVTVLIFKITTLKTKAELMKSPWLILLFLSSLPMIANILQHYIFGTRYMVDRVAIFYYPLMVLLFLTMLNNFSDPKVKIISQVIAVLFGIATLLNLLKAFNFHKTATYFFDAHSEEVVDYLLNQRDKEMATPIVLSSEWPYNGTLHYYTRSIPDKIEYIREHSFKDSIYGDYFLHMGFDLPEYGFHSINQPILKMAYDTALAFPEEGVYLFKLKKVEN